MTPMWGLVGAEERKVLEKIGCKGSKQAPKKKIAEIIKLSNVFSNCALRPWRGKCENKCQDASTVRVKEPKMRLLVVQAGVLLSLELCFLLEWGA